MTDISVIIPTYNRLWCLPKAVESCRHGRCSVQIIVVDDGSDDGTWEWLATQSDVVGIRQHNLGKDWAVNRGMARATGEFVRFLDSDDMLLPGANDSQLATAREFEADVVVAGHRVCDEANRTVREIEWTPCDDFIAQQLGECDSSHYSAYLFRRKFVDDIPHRPEFGVRDDRMFVIEVALREPKVATIASLSLVHQHHFQERLQFQSGLAAAITNGQHLKIYRTAARRLEAEGKLTPRRRRAMAKALWPLAHWIAYTHHDEACEVAKWISELDPDFHIPEHGVLGWLYRRLGFRRTEQILWFRRIALKLISSR